MIARTMRFACVVPGQSITVVNDIHPVSNLSDMRRIHTSPVLALRLMVKTKPREPLRGRFPAIPFVTKLVGHARLKLSVPLYLHDPISPLVNLRRPDHARSLARYLLGKAHKLLWLCMRPQLQCLTNIHTVNCSIQYQSMSLRSRSESFSMTLPPSRSTSRLACALLYARSRSMRCS